MLRYHVTMSNTPVSAPDEVIALRAKVSEQAAEIEHLKLVIAKLRRMQFGRSSEQMNEMLGQCHRPAHWSQLMIGTMEPPRDRHIEASP